MTSRSRGITILVSLACATLLLADPPGAVAQTGYGSLFIGHSFFRPFADGMPFHAAQAGIVGHSQDVVFAGGANGAPKALWDDPAKRAEIQSILDGGDVELFAMTYHPDHPGLDGYTLWMDYALERNPDTIFFLALPWLTEPASLSSGVYANVWLAAHASAWHGLIDDLRQLYPEVPIYCLPYGQGAGELRLLFDAGSLSDVSSMIGPAPQSIFTDSLGHPGDILVELGRLVWINALYGVDLTTYAYDPGYATDLKEIARSIMDAHDATYATSMIRPTKFVLKDAPAVPTDPSKRRLTLRSSASKAGPSGVSEPAFGGKGDPTAAGTSGGGATLTLYKVGGSAADVVTFDLPAASWSRVGNSLLPGYKYEDRLAAAGPIRKVRLGRGRLIVSGKGEGLYGLENAPQEEMALRLRLGSGVEFCSVSPALSPASKFDSTRTFQGDSAAPLPALCPPVPEGPAYGPTAASFVVRPQSLF